VVSALRNVRVVIAKLGMDAHWRGAIVIAHAFRDAGMEVVYLGHAAPEAIARAALEEDAPLVGLSTLSGNHGTEVPRVLAALREQGCEDVAVIVGGTIPAEDADALKRAGVAEVFATGSSLAEILERVAEILERRAGQ
jgi:methylmalonyl-CoA mutase C-terminal domain/subunit